MNDFATLLNELKGVHRALLEATDAYEAMLRRPAPDAMLLTNIRLKLTAASGRRRVMLETIYAALGELPPGDAERIRALRAESAASMMRSSRHIAVWTLREVERDWRGYVAASREVAPTVRAGVLSEQRIFYPLLAGRTRSAA